MSPTLVAWLVRPMPESERRVGGSVHARGETALGVGMRLLRLATRSPVTVYLGVAVLCRGVNFFLIPLYTHKLSLTQYGDLALAQSAVALLPMVLTLGVQSAVPRAFYREQDRREGMRQAGHVGAWVAVISVAAAALFELVVIALVPATDGRSLGRLEASCVLVASVGYALTSIPSVIFRAAQKPVIAAFFQALEAFSVGGFTVYFLVVRTLGLRGAILGLTCAYTLNGLVGLVIVFGYLGGRLGRSDLRDLLRFSFPFVPHYAANWAQAASDRWVLKGSGYDATLGAFALASQLLSPATMTLLAFHDYASARMGESFRGGGLDGLGRACRAQRKQYFVSALVPTIACLAVIPLVPYIIGRSFVAAFWTLPLLAIIGLIDSQYFPNSNVLYFAEKTALIPRVTVLTGIANIALNLALIPRVGLPGAIVARAATVLLRSGTFAVLANGTLAARREAPT